MADKPLIFISYSQRDRAWLDYVRSFFEPLAGQWNLQIWDDQQLRIGDDWNGDINSAVDACRVFVLLVSRYSLASPFIVNEEVTRILKRPRGEVEFCPVVVTPYYAPKLDWLDQANRRPPDGKALSELTDPDRDREMTLIAAHVAKLVEPFVDSAARSSPQTRSRPAFPSIVDYGRLPETPYKRLVGREVELKQLDAAWSDQKTRIVSLVGWGGTGKTSLVIEWLTRFRNDGYRGADAVLCWSFYSQGAEEHATTSEGLIDWVLTKLRIEIHTTSSIAKADRLAEELSRRRALLVLDGLEPLQHGPGTDEGALKDEGVGAFLTAFANGQAGSSLLVLTTRAEVRDLQRWKGGSAWVIDLSRLSDEAGAALLFDLGVFGPAEELRAAAHEFAGNALALNLLAGFLKVAHEGDVRLRNRIRPAVHDPDDPARDQAERVLEAFNKDWLTPDLRTIMFMIGLFDGPAPAHVIAALRAKPAVRGLTEPVIDLDDENWRAAIARLRGVGLLDPEDSLAPDALDVHPLVRKWFGDLLKETNETAWREAHDRLNQALRDTDHGSKGAVIHPLEAVEPQSDEPTSDDQLGRRPFAQALVERLDRLHEKGGHDGFAAHIHAPWGAGKTSILMMMREIMKLERTSVNGTAAPRWVVIEFNAWKHERRNPPWWPLMEHVKAGCLKALSQERIGCIRLWKECFRRLPYFGHPNCDQAAAVQVRWIWWKVRTDAVAYAVALFVIVLCFWMLLAGGTTLELILKVFTAAVAAFAAFFAASRAAFFGSMAAAKLYDDIAHDPLKRITSFFTEIVNQTGRPICVFIDDLDRCRIDYVVDLLEGIQTSFRHRNVAYVVAADRSWIKASFEARYSGFVNAVGNLGQPLGYLFLEKIFQISTPVPGMGNRTRSTYWNWLLKGARSTEIGADGKPGEVTTQLSTQQEREQFDNVVKEKREQLRREHGENLTRAQAEEALVKSDAPADRAAVVLELNASPAAEKEAEHLLMRFTDLLPDNPRVMKRMVNAFAMRQAIGLLERNLAPAEILARWTILEQRFPALADLLIEHPEWMDALEEGEEARKRDSTPPFIVPFLDSETIRIIIGSGEKRLSVDQVRSITRGSAT